MNAKDRNLIKMGNNIKKIRKKENLSQEELAFKAGLHRPNIAPVKGGERIITILNLIKISESLRADLTLLLDLNEKDDKDE